MESFLNKKTMNNLELQINNLESKILLKENKLIHLEKEITELQKNSKATYEKCTLQEETLLKKGATNILWELKINNLKKEKIILGKEIEDTNKNIDLAFEEYKRNQIEIKENVKKLQELSNSIKNQIIKKNQENNQTIHEENQENLVLLQQFLKQKQAGTVEYLSILKKRQTKVTVLHEKKKEKETEIQNICKRILLLWDQIEYGLFNIKNRINQKLKNDSLNTIFSQNQRSTLLDCFDIIDEIAKRELIQKQIFINKYRIEGM